MEGEGLLVRRPLSAFNNSSNDDKVDNDAKTTSPPRLRRQTSTSRLRVRKPLNAAAASGSNSEDSSSDDEIDELEDLVFFSSSPPSSPPLRCRTPPADLDLNHYAFNAPKMSMMQTASVTSLKVNKPLRALPNAFVDVGGGPQQEDEEQLDIPLMALSSMNSIRPDVRARKPLRSAAFSVTPSAASASAIASVSSFLPSSSSRGLLSMYGITPLAAKLTRKDGSSLEVPDLCVHYSASLPSLELDFEKLLGIEQNEQWADDQEVMMLASVLTTQQIEYELQKLRSLYENKYISLEEAVRRSAVFVKALKAKPQPKRAALTVDKFLKSRLCIEPIGLERNNDEGGSGEVVRGALDTSLTRNRAPIASHAQNRNVRVFISSTFRDMTDEREHLVKFTFPKLRKFCSERGVFLTQVDLRWGITTEQSKAGDTINICLSEIDRCRPYFVCMLGDRYGWAQPRDGSKEDELLALTFKRAESKFPWIHAYYDRSITELEVRHAVLNDPSESTLKHSLFYFRQPLSRPSASASSYNVSLESNTSRSLDPQESLKAEIKSIGAQVKEYREPSQLGECILEQLQQVIEHDFPLSSMPTALQKEALAHEAFASIRARVYIGRQYYFDCINEHFAQHNTAGKPLVVVGESGSGKSSLVCNWTFQHKASHPDQLIIAHYIGSTSASTDLARMLVRIMTEIKEHFQVKKDIPSDLKEMTKALAEWIGEAASRGGFTLVLDALNQLEDREGAHKLEWLPREFPNNVKVLISTLPGSCLTATESRGWPTLRVQPLTKAERRVLIAEYMKQYAKTLTSQQIDLVMAAPQTTNPLFLRTLLEEIRVFGVFEELDRHIEHYLTAKDPPALFELVFSRVEADMQQQQNGHSTFDPVGDALALLWVSRRGLSENELVEALAISPSLWSRLHIAFEEALVDRSGMLTFFHDYMRQAVERRYLKRTPQNYNKYRQRIVSYFSGLQGKEFAQRKSEEVPHQLFEMEEWRALGECITDIDMFLTLFEDEHKFDLYRYWQAVQKQKSTSAQSPEDLLLAKLRLYQATKTKKMEAKSSSSPSPPSASKKLVRVLSKAAKFLEDMAAYDNAELLYRQALQMATEAQQAESGSQEQAEQKAAALDSLAYLLRLRGKYTEAAPLYQQAVALREKILGKEHPDLAQSINSLAILYRHQGKYKDAEPLYQRALEIRKKAFGETHVEVAQSYNSLGCLNQDMGRYEVAEAHFQRAIALREQLCGPNHPDVAMSITNLAGLYLDQNRYAEAAPLYKRGLAIYEGVFGSGHPSVAQTLNAMAAAAQEQGNYDEAIRLYTRTLEIKEKVLGAMHPELALTLNDFAVLYARLDRLAEAAPLYERALAIRDAVLGKNHPDYAQSLNNLGSLYQDMGRYNDALPMFQEALRICERAFGREHMDVAGTLTNIAGLYQFLKRYEEALPLYTRALQIYENLLGSKHADVAVALNDILSPCSSFCLFFLSCFCYLVSMLLLVYVFLTTLMNAHLAVLYFNMKNYEEAEKRYQRALEIYEAVVGPGHPDVGQALSNLAEFYKARGEGGTKALPLLERAHSIYAAALGPQHARTVAAARSVARLRQQRNHQ
ncbi:DUF4062 domain-containing protein [Balamuthia mandrillaris]